MKIGLTGVLGKPSTRLSSHNAGHTFYAKSRLEEFFKSEVEVIEISEAEDFDAIVLTEGVNFREGSYNLFGGVSDKLIENLKFLHSFLGKVYSFGPETIDYTGLVKKRISELVFTMPETIKITENDFNNSKFILGDSHSLSVYEKGFGLSRNDGKTLHGFLTEGIEYFIPKGEIEIFRMYAGNIDVRHHLCRLFTEDEVFEAVDKMLLNLEAQLSDLMLDRVNSIELVELLPIENESRKLPKTGYFEGKPFHGDWAIRNAVRNHFNDKLEMVCDRNNFKLLKWPDMTNLLGELDFSYMEARQSVHLAPKRYMFKETFIT